jgi:glycine cleavage system H protein
MQNREEARQRRRRWHAKKHEKEYTVAESEYSIPDDCLYTEQDEWIRWDDNRVIIGVTDYAQQQLGDIVFVELPEVGTTISIDETFGVIESVKAVSDLFAPITGEVVAINESLANVPEQINEDCYGEGWMLAVVPSHEDERDRLLEAVEYQKSIAKREE